MRRITSSFINPKCSYYIYNIFPIHVFFCGYRVALSARSIKGDPSARGLGYVDSVPSQDKLPMRRNWFQHNLVREQMGHPVQFPEHLWTDLALLEPLSDEDDDGAALLVVAGRAVEAGRLFDRAQVLLPRPPQQLLETAMETDLGE